MRFMPGSEERPVSSAKMWEERSSKQSSSRSKPDLSRTGRTTASRHGPGRARPRADIQRHLQQVAESRPRMGRPSECRVAHQLQPPAKGGRHRPAWARRSGCGLCAPCPDACRWSRSRSGAGRAARRRPAVSSPARSPILGRAGQAVQAAGLSRTSCWRSSSRHCGWVKSPVPSTLMPLAAGPRPPDAGARAVCWWHGKSGNGCAGRR